MRVSVDSFKPIYAADLFLGRHYVTDEHFARRHSTAASLCTGPVARGQCTHFDAGARIVLCSNISAPCQAQEGCYHDKSRQFAGVVHDLCYLS